MSCASAGNCSAGGYYTDGSGRSPGVRRHQVNGTWGTARGGARHRRPQQGRNAAVNSVSCASAGNCSAGGYYTDGSGASRRSSSARRTAPGARQGGARHRGPQHGRERTDHSRCRARRRATAAPAGSTPTAAIPGVRGQPGERHLGQGQEVPGTAALNTGGNARIIGVVRVGGQLQRRRVLHRRLRHSRRSWSARPTAPGGRRRRCPAPGPQHGRGRPGQLGVVRLGGQLQRRRGLRTTALGS